MVVDVERRAASVPGGKMVARACDACMKRSRASWYCPADDAFLCQSCDSSIHSANHLAKRHERVRLQSSSWTETTEKTTSVWYEGFRRKARTPRNKGLAFEKLLQMEANDPLVPDLGGEEEEVFFSFSSVEENEESLNCCVPVFDPFSDMVIDDINGFCLVPDEVINNTTNGEELGELEREVIDDEGFIGFLPLDMDLEDLTMDVERLLEEGQLCLGLKEPNDIGVIKEENNVGFEIDCKDLKRVKDEEEEEAKCENGGSKDSDGEASKDEDRKTSLFLSLDYEAVITAWDNHGSPWKTGIKSECLVSWYLYISSLF